MVNQHILKKLLQLFVALYSLLHIYIHIARHFAENFLEWAGLRGWLWLSFTSWNEDLSNSLLGDTGKAGKQREQLSNLGLYLTWAMHWPLILIKTQLHNFLSCTWQPDPCTCMYCAHPSLNNAPSNFGLPPNTSTHTPLRLLLPWQPPNLDSILDYVPSVWVEWKGWQPWTGFGCLLNMAKLWQVKF